MNAVKTFRKALEKPGGQITIAVPLDSWMWLAGICAHFDTGQFGAMLCAKLGAIETAHERAQAEKAKAENDAALKVEADRLRAEEAAV